MKKLLFMASLVLAGCNAPEPATLVVKTDPNSEVVWARKIRQMPKDI